MNWVSVKSLGFKKQERKCWHLWFAWHPVSIGTYPDGAKEWIWWENVQRKGIYDCSYPGDCYWNYRYKRNDK